MVCVCVCVQMMQQLLLTEGQLINVKSATLPKGTYTKLQPVDETFLDLTNPKAVYGLGLSASPPNLSILILTGGCSLLQAGERTQELVRPHRRRRDHHQLQQKVRALRSLSPLCV